jgi:uncharacterized protein YyaL (SSP411 family)
MDLRYIKRFGRSLLDYAKIPAIAKIEALKDLRGLPSADSGPSKSIYDAIQWLERAQDNSISKDGGVARHYSYLTGWGPSYPEITGCIIPTVVKYAKQHNDTIIMNRAEKMLKFLVSIQFPDGGFQAGTMGAHPLVPCTFNTGQIILGIAEGVRTFGNRYKKTMIRAADWLLKVQESDGCWRKFPSPFASSADQCFDSIIGWGLLEAAEIDNNEKYYSSAISNVNWILKQQKDNGWIDNCCLSSPSKPLTHTIGYAFRGILEAYTRSKDERVFKACINLADGLLKPLRDDGFLPGRLSSKWNGEVNWVCLTGSVQIAECWFLMYEFTSKKKYLKAALSTNEFVRKTQNSDGPLDVLGAIKGSFPIYGDYGKYEFLSWATKYFIDSNTKEIEILAKNENADTDLKSEIRI